MLSRSPFPAIAWSVGMARSRDTAGGSSASGRCWSAKRVSFPRKPSLPSPFFTGRGRGGGGARGGAAGGARGVLPPETAPPPPPVLGGGGGGGGLSARRHCL